MKDPDELLRVAHPFWEAEGEITSRFFHGNPGKEDHLLWLRAQMWKEMHPVDGYFNGIHKELFGLAEMFPRIDRGVDRHHFLFLYRQMGDEINHYILFADIFEFLTGRKIDLGTDIKQLPQEKKLQEVRSRYVSASPIGGAAVLFTEGGGAAMFREGAKVKGGALEEMIAKAMHTIYEDEKNHAMEGAMESIQLIKNDDDAREMKSAIAEVSRQRVSMRLEMFGYPMSEAEADRFIAAQA